LQAVVTGGKPNKDEEICKKAIGRDIKIGLKNPQQEY
jgi:hypothetical protein